MKLRIQPLRIDLYLKHYNINLMLISKISYEYKYYTIKYQTLDIEFLVIWLAFYSRYKSYIL